MGHTGESRATGNRRAKVTRAVDEWVSQLVDLTGNNRLLYYRTLKRGTLELTDADETGLSTLLSERTVRLSQLMPPTDDEPDRHDDALRRARTIHGRARTYFEERGIKTLFLALGMATWTTETSSATPSAPVLLRPLRFKPRGAAETDFDVCLHGDWDVNATLLHLLATDYKVDLDSDQLLELLETDSGAGAPDPTPLFERLGKEAAAVPDFEIRRRLVVGTFAYTKLPMVRDLEMSVDALVAHDLISAIAGDEAAQASIRELGQPDLSPSQPDHTPPGDEFLILDADASQNLAINAALAGEPLIIQGPPGTGKSQTIANLIASKTARGRRVLFVAEKRAAIDAVTKRLRAAGLGDVVMDLHGGVTSKRQLAGELARTLDDIARIPQVDLSELHHELESSRSALNDHAAAVHTTRQPWGLSVAEISQQLIGLGDVPDPGLRLTGSRLEHLDGETAHQAREHLLEWADLAEPLLTSRSPWTGAQVTSEADARHALDLVDQVARDLLPEARAQLDRVLDRTSLPRPASIDEWQQVLALLTDLDTLFSEITPEIYELDLTDLGDALDPASRSWWSRMLAQLFESRYRTAKRKLRDLCRGEGKPNGPRLHVLVTSALEHANRWRDLDGHGPPRLPDDLEAAASSHQNLTGHLAAVGAYLVTHDLTRLPHDRVDEDVDALQADQQTLFRLPRVHELESWLTEHYLGPLLEGVRTGRIRSDEIVEAFDHAWLSSIRTQVVARDSRLANFDGRRQDRQVDRFQRSDRSHLERSAVRIRRAVAEGAVAACNEHPEQYQLVRKEAYKKSRHLTLRQLFDEAPDVLTALRPCWTMSPLVVSQTLPPAQLFDLVIFDEASQVLPADAVPALLRAPQAVVAGDRHQLPPTTFFDRTVESDEDDDASALTIGFESVLDVLDTLLSGRMLSWHYRSQDERLIAFSNHHIYDSGLTTFPGASADDCLEHVLIPHRLGVEVDTRSNGDEVVRVVDHMIEHARHRPDESLGVIAMGQYHADRIESALRDRLSQAEAPELEAFFDESRGERAFVKNLERVQGDERDAIILSIGYAKQPDGRLFYRFGPLNREGGERRLNVAITRARRRMTVVSSFSHTDMEPGRSSAEGVELLRRYLKYVESGGRDLDGAENAPSLNPFERDVKYRLERTGLEVVPQYGTSGFRIDFALPHPTKPGRFALAVEADGASYHSSHTARDRDRLRQEVLEQLGWRFHRIWSTDWFHDPQSETEKVVRAYERAVGEIDNGQRTTTDRGGQSPRSVNDGKEEPPLRPEPRPNIPPGGSIRDYGHGEMVALARWIQSDTLLRTDDQMMDLMMNELGFQRRGSRIVEALKRAIRAA